MNYWLDLFTGTTWEEFQKAGAKVSGFREKNWTRAGGIKRGDVLLCYLTGVQRWVGLLEVTGERRKGTTRIWKDELFPVRFPVKPLVMLPPEHGVPMQEFRGKLSFFAANGRPGGWTGHLRSSPTKYSKSDGELISGAIREAAARPLARPVDPKKLGRSPNLYKLKKKSGKQEIETVVSIPSKDQDESNTERPEEAQTHTEIQWRLLDLGSRLGLKVWAPKGDRSRTFNGQKIAEIPRLLDTLPLQFDEATTQTIENIDVLWLSGNAIVAAFEVEHSTSIYSGLLRMSDLLTMQPNIEIKLYLVAPDARHSKFATEVPRPTFASRNKPLHTICGFLPYSKLCRRLEHVKDLVQHLKPEFIDDIAEFAHPEEGLDA